jgi:hypothetical protein
MLVLLHVIIALSSIGFSTYLFFFPSHVKLRISYGLIIATLASGTYLVWSTHAPLIQACTTGLIYLGIVSVGVASAHYKLSHAAID